MFLKLDEIARELGEIYLPLEQEGITGMRLSPQCDSSACIQALEKAQETLGVKFPLALSRLVCKFDFGEFEICNVRFGVGGDYASELVRLNSADEYGGKWLCGRRVASDFERFFRALAGIDIARLSKKAVPCEEEIAKFVQADDDMALEFWRETAEI